LVALAADPAGVASKFGKLHGKCCFCHKSLSDPASTAVGYGKVCASHYGLPWGDTPFTHKAAPSEGAAALKKLAELIMAGKADPVITGPHYKGTSSGYLKPPSLNLHDELKKVAAETKADAKMGDKVAPVLTPEEYARIKARVEVLF
jgi:hypothetical protein